MGWNSIYKNVLKAMYTEMIYHSLVEKRAYKIISVEEDTITIARMSGGENDSLTKAEVERAIEKIKATGGKIKRRTLISPTVAKETTLVLFNPNLSWDETREFILYKP